MNIYEIPTKQKSTKDLLRLLGLTVFLGNEFDINSDKVIVETEFSLSNLNKEHFKHIVYSSAHQNVIENFDKPIVEIKDIVICAVPEDKLADTTELYDNFIRINGFFEDVDAKPVHALIGVSNSSNTDFFEPFSGLQRVAFHADKIDIIATTYGLAIADDFNDIRS